MEKIVHQLMVLKLKLQITIYYMILKSLQEIEFFKMQKEIQKENSLF